MLSSGGTNDVFGPERLSRCGAQFCNDVLLPPAVIEGNSSGIHNDTLGEPSHKPPIEKIYTLAAILLAFALLAAVIIAVFVDPLSRSVNYKSS